ncbi:MAG TPA: hypothetical protein VIL48_14105 [Acidimicrobiales bacterium]
MTGPGDHRDDPGFRPKGRPDRPGPRSAPRSGSRSEGRPEPADLHELVSFDDPHERRTWVFDVTFLLSPWRCLYGRGCPGVLTEPAAELEQGCCSYGAHLIDEADEADVLAAAARLTDAQWQHRRVAARRGGPLRKGPGGATVTRMVGDACIFLNRPGFPGGAGCALHRAALEAGERPLDWKPDVCWQLPLRRIDTVDDSGQVVSTLREWKRRDWGAGGDDFHWWCTDAPEAFTASAPVYETLRDEIVEMTSAWAYERFVDHVAAGRRTRGHERFAPHPVLRRRRTRDQGRP